MPLFECEECGVVENTALGRYWGADVKKCSLCDTGEWHGRFERRTPEEAGYVEKADGFLGYEKEE